MQITYKDWNIEEMCGYHPITTFYMDFSIADGFGISAIKDTFKRAMVAWRDDYKFLTELVMVLNWKIWEHYGHNNQYADVYNDLWKKADAFAMKHLKGEELDYFYRTTD